MIRCGVRRSRPRTRKGVRIAEDCTDEATRFFRAAKDLTPVGGSLVQNIYIARCPRHLSNITSSVYTEVDEETFIVGSVMET
jgi:hypothetical protein